MCVFVLSTRRNGVVVDRERLPGRTRPGGITVQGSRASADHPLGAENSTALQACGLYLREALASRVKLVGRLYGTAAERYRVVGGVLSAADEECAVP